MTDSMNSTSGPVACGPCVIREPQRRGMKTVSKYPNVPWFVDPVFRPTGFGQETPPSAAVLKNVRHKDRNGARLEVRVDLWGPIRLSAEVDGVVIEFVELDQIRALATAAGFQGISVRFGNS